MMLFCHTGLAKIWAVKVIPKIKIQNLHVPKWLVKKYPLTISQQNFSSWHKLSVEIKWISFQLNIIKQKYNCLEFKRKSPCNNINIVTLNCDQIQKTNDIKCIVCPWIRVSNWLLLNIKWAVFFQPYHGENTLYFYVKVMVSALYYSNILSWNFLVEDHWTSPQIDMLLQSDILPWFRVNQFLLLLLNVDWLAEKQQIPIL
jgi:hypothetical protein